MTLKHPLPWLGLTLLLVAACAVDSLRPPPDQLTARLYLNAVALYQQHIQPATAPYIRCRYTPTCSRYSQQAVQRYGIAKGLVLTLRRVASCNGSVPLGTLNPVP